MSSHKIRSSFTAEHQASLLGWIARQVIRQVGEERGEEVVRRAAGRCGEQSGRRMALRAQANGHELSMLNYMSYTEWKPVKREFKIKVIEKVPHFHIQVFKCPWMTAWEKNGLSQYTRCYCPELDESALRGFNPKLTINIPENRAKGAPYCDIVFHDANLNLKSSLVLMVRKMCIQKRALLPWDYHTGQVFKTMGEVIVSELGKQGEETMQAALKEFAQHYGEDRERIVAEYKDTDFNSLPKGK